MSKKKEELPGDTYTVPTSAALTMEDITNAVKAAASHNTPLDCEILMPKSAIIYFMIYEIENLIERGMSNSAQKMINSLNKSDLRKCLKRSKTMLKFIGKYGDMLYE